MIATTVAVTAQFLSDHYGVPAMLMALLLGIAFHFLAEEGRCVPGIEITSMLKRVTGMVGQITNGSQKPQRLSRLTSEFYFKRAADRSQFDSQQ